MEPHFPLKAWVCGSVSGELEEFESPTGIFSEYAYFSSFSIFLLRMPRGTWT